MTEIYGEDGPTPDDLAQIPLGRLGTPREFGDVVCFSRLGPRVVRDRNHDPRGRRGFPLAAMRRLFSAGRLLALGLVLIAVVLGLALVPSNDYIFLPDPAHPVAPLVTVPGGHDPAHGKLYFVDIVVRKASLLERLFGGLHHGADVFPASAVNPPGVDDAQRAQIEVQDMSRSEQIAAAVALKAAGKNVTLKATGARVDVLQPGMPAVGKLEPDDVLTAVNGARVRSPQDVHTAMSKYHVGDVVRFTPSSEGRKSS